MITAMVLSGTLTSLLILLLVALVIVVIAERFSPDPMITWVVRAIVFVVVIVKLIEFL